MHAADCRLYRCLVALIQGNRPHQPIDRLTMRLSRFIRAASSRTPVVWAGLLLAGLCADTAFAVDLPAPAPATVTRPAPRFGLDQAEALAASRAAVGATPADYQFRDRQGQAIRLSRYRGKPLLVNFIYTGCFEVCPTSSRALRKAVDAMRERFGVNQFQVLSIGFNQPADSPIALREFAARQRIDDPNWELLSPRAEDVAALAADFGFRYAATPLGFDHTLQVSILDANGRIHQQVYGDAFAADSLGEPLKQLLAGGLIAETGSLNDLFDKVRILCSVYDPVTGKYRVNYAMYLEIAGGLTFILTLAIFAWLEWRTHRRQQRLLRVRHT